LQNQGFSTQKNYMDNSNKIATLVVPVPYKGAGNIIRQNPVSFDVYREGHHYRAVPLLNLEERRTANLPPELLFTHDGGKAQSQRGTMEGNMHIIEAIVGQLQAGGG
jgi:hypothetical protein